MLHALLSVEFIASVALLSAIASSFAFVYAGVRTPKKYQAR
jgi:hypothetical protein